MKKLIAIIAIMVTSFANVTFASEIGDHLDELRYIELQLSAVTTDMYLYLGWLPEEKDMMKNASRKAIADLNDVKNNLTILNVPKELANFKEMDFQLIDRLQKIYNGIEKKELEEIKKEFSTLDKLYLRYSEEAEKAHEKYNYKVELLKDTLPITEEIKLIQGEKDKNIYSNAVKLMKERNYAQAYKYLNNLRIKYKDTAFEDCVMLKLSNCMMIPDKDISEEEDKIFDYDKALEVLSEIIDKGRYSPVLYEAFDRWRTSEQSFYHGMSNMSEIPNKEYNNKRWKIVQTIKRYLKSNPNDTWAKTQIVLLLDLPNIQRGGPFGNDNIEHWGMLYSDIIKKEKDNKP